MKCLLTGATGFLGANVVFELVRAGHTVRALGLPGSETRYIRDHCEEIFFGDVTSWEDVDAAVSGVDAVIHAAGDTSFWKRNFARQRAVNVDGSVTPCCYLRPDMGDAYVMGNVFKTPFVEVWRGERYRAFRERMQRDRSAMPVCGTCRGGTHDLLVATEEVKA